MKRLVQHVRSNVVAYIALFVALGGTSAYAANTVFSTDIVDGEVKRPDLQNNAVNNAKLAGASVTKAKVAANAVDSSKVADNSLIGADIDESTLNLPSGGGTSAGLVEGTVPHGAASVHQTVLNTPDLQLKVSCSDPPGGGSTRLHLRLYAQSPQAGEINWAYGTGGASGPLSPVGGGTGMSANTETEIADPFLDSGGPQVQRAEGQIVQHSAGKVTTVTLHALTRMDLFGGPSSCEVSGVAVTAEAP
jgi:hypothetical protein